MARKKALPDSGEAVGVKKRIRRTPEQIIADLQEEIERVKAKAATKALKVSPSHKLALTAVKNIDRAMGAAAEEDLGELRHMLADCRRILGGYLEGRGIALPKADMPRGRRPKSTAVN